MKTTRLSLLVFVAAAVFSAAARLPGKRPSWRHPMILALPACGLRRRPETRSRLAAPPLDKPAFILADLSLKQERLYTGYSGDVSGRWIGAGAFLAPLYPKPFAALPAILAEIPTYQKADGHFGAEQHLPDIDRVRDFPILWGNGRLLVGLLEVYQRTGDRKVLQVAKRIGDYFVATDAVFNKAENLRYWHFVSCYFASIEGLTALSCATKEKRYLDEAKRIAKLALMIDNFEGFHAHCRLSTLRGVADLYAATGEQHWLEAAEGNWKIFMDRYRLPTAGVKELLSAEWDLDEGSAVCDWLRLNLSLWRQTGDGRYLDEAERCLKGHFIFQQFPNGGAGHRRLYQLEGQTVAFKSLGEDGWWKGGDAWWCCSEHWARATVEVARFAVTSGEQGPCINLAIDCEGAVAGPGGKWKIKMRETADGLRDPAKPDCNRGRRAHPSPGVGARGRRIDKPAARSR